MYNTSKIYITFTKKITPKQNKLYQVLHSKLFNFDSQLSFPLLQILAASNFYFQFSYVTM